MFSAPAIAAYVTIGTAAVSGNVQRIQGRKAGKLQEKANDIQQASASVEASRRRRQAVAKSRIVRAQNTAAGVAQGITGTSSPLAGANASVTSNLASNVSSLNRATTTSQQTFGLRQDAQDRLQRGRTLKDFAAVPGAALGAAAAAQQVFN